MMGNRAGTGKQPQIRQWLIDAREQKGLTQGAVAAAVGLTQPSYWSIEKGETKNPDPKIVKKIAAVLGFSWTKLYDDEDEDEKSVNVDAFE